jgi:virginiamycin A acetyltransferase
MILRYLTNKILTTSYILFRRDIDLDLHSKAHPKVFKYFRGNSKYKIVIRNSHLFGNISAELGCKLFDVTCGGNIKLGRFVSLNGPGTRISSRLHGIEIGSFSSIASNVIIQEDYHRVDKVSTYFMNQNIFKNGITEDVYSKGKIKIEEDVWIGSNSVILSGVTIGRGSIIGAGSVVTKDIPRYSIVAGNPARVIKKRFEENIIRELEASNWWELKVDKMMIMQEFFNENLQKKKS